VSETAFLLALFLFGVCSLKELPHIKYALAPDIKAYFWHILAC
jgi:hypothetical protein